MIVVVLYKSNPFVIKKIVKRDLTSIRFPRAYAPRLQLIRSGFISVPLLLLLRFPRAAVWWSLRARLLFRWTRAVFGSGSVPTAATRSAGNSGGGRYFAWELVTRVLQCGWEFRGFVAPLIAVRVLLPAYMLTHFSSSYVLASWNIKFTMLFYHS